MILGVIIGFPIGITSATFLYLLEFATNFREINLWLIVFIPIAGWFIGTYYERGGNSVSAGNNLILKEYTFPNTTLPWHMAPSIFITTLLTHLVGGSAGREGTAIQMGATISDQFHRFGRTFKQNRSTFLAAGIAGGFGSLFGTPIAGAVFAMEILRNRKIDWDLLAPTFFTSFFAYLVCDFLGAPHTRYVYIELPELGFSNISFVTIVAVLFGITALIYIHLSKSLTSFFTKRFPTLTKRAFYGGIILFLVYMIPNTEKYMGLGIPSILNAFEEPTFYLDFAIKLLLTALTLSIGFRGGEVTPLFFIGATLGSALSIFIPLPVAFLAALGFLAVFAGATKTFLACTVMGIELFGWESFPYFLFVCLVAQMFSGKKSIYENLNNSFSILKF